MDNATHISHFFYHKCVHNTAKIIKVLVCNYFIKLIKSPEGVVNVDLNSQFFMFRLFFHNKHAISF